MYGVRHDFIEEFPHLAREVTSLKNSDPAFLSLYERYDVTDRAIYGLTRKALATPDEYLKELKRKRVMLKDRLCAYIARRRST